MKSHPFKKGKNVVSKLLHTKASDAKIKKTKKTQQPLDGLAVVLRRSNFIVAGVEERRGILYKVPEIKRKKTFDPFLLLTHSCES